MIPQNSENQIALPKDPVVSLTPNAIDTILYVVIAMLTAFVTLVDIPHWSKEAAMVSLAGAIAWKAKRSVGTIDAKPSGLNG